MTGHSNMNFNTALFLLFRRFNLYHLAFKSQCRQIAGDLFIFKCPFLHLCGPAFSLLAVKLHLLGQGHLVELIKVKYLKSKILTRKQYDVIFVIPVTTSTSPPTKKKGISLHSNGAISNLQHTDKLFMVCLLALSAAQDYLVLNE